MSEGIPTSATITSLLSLVLGIPVVNRWFSALVTGRKAATIFVLSIAVGVGVFLYQFPPETWGNLALSDWLQLAQNIIAAIISGQVTHSQANQKLWQKG